MGRAHQQYLAVAVTLALVSCTDTPVAPDLAGDAAFSQGHGEHGSGPPASILFTHRTTTLPPNLWIMDPDGGNQRQLTFSTTNVTPDWSPNGRLIAFTSNRTGDLEIFVMAPDGSNPVQLTDSPGIDQGPSWSPNGKEIVFYSDRSGDFEIYVMSADGSNVRAVTNHPGVDQYPDWSPNGKHIAYQRDGDIYLLDLADGSTRLVWDDPEFSDMPEFSPDGKKLVFMSRHTGVGTYIFVVVVASGEAVNLTPKPAGHTGVWNNFFPSWSTNGRQIYFAGNQPPLTSDAEILVMNADGTGVTRLTLQPGLNSAPVMR